MKALDEARVREQLERAVRPIDPVAPSLATVRARAVRRKRTRRAVGGFMAVAVAGATAAVVATVVAAAPGGTSTVHVAATPTHQSLVRYARSHGGLRVAGPFAGKPGWYGAFSTKRAIVVAHYVGKQWRTDGHAVTSLGKGKFVTRLGLGPSLGSSATTPSIAVRIIGGDVSYFGSVLRHDAKGWRPATFGGCGHHGLCFAPSNSEPYGHPVAGVFTSVNNNCTPNCAAGTEYRVTWRWSSGAQKFVSVSEHVVSG